MSIAERVENIKAGEYCYPLLNERFMLYKISGDQKILAGVIVRLFRSDFDFSTVLADTHGGYTVNIANPEYCIEIQKIT